jgi:hypothetical protein
MGEQINNLILKLIERDHWSVWKGNIKLYPMKIGCESREGCFQ